MNQYKSFKSEMDWEIELCEAILSRIQNSDKSTIYNIALAGGTTPFGIYRRLKNNLQDLNLEHRVKVFVTDERDVPVDDDESNIRRIVEIFGKDRVAFFNPKSKDGLKSYNKLLERALARNNYAFDLVILGLGEDGHVASLFPSNVHSDLEQSSFFIKSWVDALQSYRFSLSYEQLRLAGEVFVVFKDNLIKQRIIREELSSNRGELPIVVLNRLREENLRIFYKEKND